MEKMNFNSRREVEALLELREGSPNHLRKRIGTRIQTLLII